MREDCKEEITMDKAKVTAYEIVLEKELPDIRSRGWLLRHKKTGARVMLVENDDENKVFNIAFRTPPKNSTGVAHILEHSVLCGSRNFPLKDPFMELVKGSLNTFLNAMTYPDKTCYPVASCNAQDFQNLMHVYRDTVFYPNVYARDEIFRQEGWHYHLEDPAGPLTYNGVVYNEMKGAYSSPDEVLQRAIMNRLFPDTPYGVESGGDPRYIPDLTYEEFLNFHHAYYHPSNSFIYLYGDMNMEEKLDYIDREYLSSFDYLKVDSEIPLQSSFDHMVESTMEYPISQSEDEEDNIYLSFSKVIGETADSMLDLAFQILDYALLSAPGAPLKKELVEAGIGSEVFGGYEDDIRQSYFSVVAKGARKDQKEDFLSIIHRVLEENAVGGIDRKSLLAGINYFEFRYREADFASYPKGLIYGLDILDNWLYSDEQPFAGVELLADFARLKEAVGTGYFENLIRRYLLDNPHGCILTLLPQKGLQAEEEKALAEKLEAYRASLSEEELEKMVKATRDLAAYQEEADRPEDIAKLPLLKREDIRRTVRKLSNEEYYVDGSLVLYHDVATNGIGYVDVLFEVETRDVEKIHYLGLLRSVLGLIDTGHYTYGELFNEINTRTGGLAAGVDIAQNAIDPEKYRIFLSFRGKTLYEEGPFLLDMLKEILESSLLDDAKRLKEIIAESRSRLSASIPASGNSSAMLRAASYASESALFEDEMRGIGYYHFLEKLDDTFDEHREETIAALSELMETICCRENLIVSYTGERESLEGLLDLTDRLRSSLPEKKAGPGTGKDKTLRCEKKNEGFMTAGAVQYVAQCGNFRKKGLAYTGALSVLKVILSYDYLWMNLRVKGGAYGCVGNFLRIGEGYFSSYRDPHLHGTLDVFSKVPEYVRNFDADERDMTKFVIGTISGKDIPLTPLTEGQRSKQAYFAGVTEEILQKERNEVLDCSAEDIRALAPIIEAVISDRQICVIGSETALENARDVLDRVEPLSH